AGLAGGLVGDGTGDAVAGAQSGKNAVENNYLSDAQLIQKDKELAECGTLVCKAGTQAKWTAIDAGQDGSFAAGMVAGVPASLYETVEGIVKMGLSPVDTWNSISALFDGDGVLSNVGGAVKQSYIDRIDKLTTEYQKAGASGSFNAGVEGGKLLTDIASLAAGGAGLAKGGVVLTEKVAAKVAGKAESAAMNAGKLSAEKEALERIGQNAKNSSDLSGKPSGAILQQQAVKKIDDLATQFNNPAVHPKDFQLNINGKTMVADPQLSLGAPVFKGANDADVMTYFKQLSGSENMPSAKVVPGKGTVYSIKVTEGPSAGSTLTLRDFSTSAQQTGAKWTIDLMTPSINGGRRVEIKFK
ncbi:VENN motif pre-toxin domain-containing protein, partial [Serratia quinivorans]